MTRWFWSWKRSRRSLVPPWSLAELLSTVRDVLDEASPAK